MSQFAEFCKVDRQLSERTASDYCEFLARFNRFLESKNKHQTQVTAEDVRSYLSTLQDKSASTKVNALKALKVFLRHFLKMPSAVELLRFPGRVYAPKIIPSKDDLRRFFDTLDNDRDRAIFLMYATSGPRKSELLDLNLANIDLEKRLIIPRDSHATGTTKNTWASCFNEEARTYLKRCLDSLRPAPVTVKRAFDRANKKTGLHITPQVVREWFCCQLGELGVPDRYVDAFCGRVPKSVLARHYTDYSPDKLKRIYDKANLTVLT